MTGALTREGGACQHPPSDTANDIRHIDTNAGPAQRWRVVVATTQAVWRRYHTEQEAVAASFQLLRHGILARAEVDK